MPFPFAYVCDLLQQLDDNRLTTKKPDSDIVQGWFAQHRNRLKRDDFNLAILLSTLLPEKRTDRVYFIQTKTLQRLCGRALCLGRSRLAELSRWEEPGGGHGDLGDCIERILDAAPNPSSAAHVVVSIEKIDGILQKIASGCRFSSPAIRAQLSSSPSAQRQLALGHLYTQLSARDAKWLTRLILKNYEPVSLNPAIVYHACHPLLPIVLSVQDDFMIAAHFLQECNRSKGVTGDPLSRDEVARRLKPKLGVKVGRQMWFKGRSIKHCLEMSHGRMSCEEKIDGEYCQIHVDLQKGNNCVQIFSKSGKDSTEDRVGLHEAIRASLKIGDRSCPIKRGCILEGELVVYSDKEQKILEFDEIRKHVSRRGVFLGTELDPPPNAWEHLMVVYYDVLAIDDESLLGVQRSERYKRLNQLISCTKGQSEVVTRQEFDSSHLYATSDLRRMFAKCIVQQREGLVLKADDPYFDFSTTRRPYSSCCIKLKKGYVGEFGDVGDFAVIGARYDPSAAKNYDLPNLKWTHFFLGCLKNKAQVQRWSAKPRFVVTNVVELNKSQLKVFNAQCASSYVVASGHEAISFELQPGVDSGNRPTVIFTDPPILDVRCFGFELKGNTNFWGLRFPVVTKIQIERTYLDAISFTELQDIAKAEKRPPPDDSQELLGWIARLENGDTSEIPFDAKSQGTSVTTLTTISPSSARSSTQHSPAKSIASELPQSPLAVRSKKQRPFSPNPIPGLPTPPTSSAAQPMEQDDPPNTSSHAEQVKAGVKRQVASPQKTPSASKIQKLSNSPQVGASQSSQTRPKPSRKKREPLADITQNSQSRDNASDSQGTPSTRPGSFTMAAEEGPPRSSQSRGSGSDATVASYHTAAEGYQPSSSQEIPDSQEQTPKPSAISEEPAEVPKCMHCPETCILQGYSILLSPCIAKMPWLTKDLLPLHGVTDFIFDMDAWREAAPSTVREAYAMDQSGAQQTLEQPPKQKVSQRPKIVFVERKRKNVSVEFLLEIEKLGLRTQKGLREYATVYDWRVLEELTKEEERCSRDGTRIDACDSMVVRSILNRYRIGWA